MLRFYDSFSHYSGNALLAKKWDVVSANGVTHSQTGGRFGGGRVTFTRTGGSFDKAEYIQKNYDGVSTVIVGMAIKQNATQGTYGGQWLEFLDGNVVQVGLAILPSGQIQAFRAAVGIVGVILHPTEGAERVVLGTSLNSVLSSSYDVLEVEIVHHATLGSITIKRADGSTFWSLTGQNTAISGVLNSSSVIVGGYVAFGGASIDMGLDADIGDFHLIDTVAGSSARDLVDFAGDLRGERLTPTADGNYAEWDPNPGPDHFANIDDSSPDDNTTYNATGVLNERDTFVVSDSTAPTTATVKAVVLTMYCRKDNGGVNGMKGMMRLAGADGMGGEFQVPSDYAFRQSFIFDTPAGAAITVANVNSSEFGYQRSS